MAEFKLNTEQKQNGVYILSEIKDEFELVYLRVREKENRIYSDEEVGKLPFASNSNPHKGEWNLRTKSFLRFQEHLKTKTDKGNILDLGCGNGWFSGILSKNFNHNFFCVDVNLTELKQGVKVFESGKIKFIYADIFSATLPSNYFNLIILNASVQYFPDIQKLFNLLFRVLTINGEVHIIDSPFYSEDEVQDATQRTLDYYSSINFQEMVQNYHHHTFRELSEFKSKIFYDPSSFKNRLKKLLSLKDSPFPWIVVKK
jgi:ubiquinone/menaquinone biosynthesis C-methylase UbiE